MTNPTGGTPNETKLKALDRLLLSLKSLVDPELPVQDRRRSGRLGCELLTSYLTETGGSGEARVLDVSRRGLRVLTGAPVGRGVTVALKAPTEVTGDFPPLMAKVVWSSRDGDGNFHSGLLLPPGAEDEPTWLEAYLLSQGFSVGEPQRRQYVRAESDLEAVLLLDAQPPLEVRVLNLSLGGAKIRAQLHLEPQSSFRLQLGPHSDLPEIELSGIILRQSSTSEEGYDHSVRFGPLERRRHTLLKEYVVNLLKDRAS